ncbi:hypothetical protein M0R45_006397 [Rubus argutus]|uniref:Uncharacterized protein n=1 Tax=Rubus argutus TaxID=59490 RepID=A0AAW1YQW7_RUBAR
MAVPPSPCSNHHAQFDHQRRAAAALHRSHRPPLAHSPGPSPCPANHAAARHLRCIIDPHRYTQTTAARVASSLARAQPRCDAFYPVLFCRRRY